MDDQRTTNDTYSEKRLKMEHEVELEKIKSNEHIVQIQADSQVKQMELLSNMVGQMI